MGFRRERFLTKFATCAICLMTLIIMWQYKSVWKFNNALTRVAINQINSDCEVIHIGIVCSGYSSHHYLYTMLKSIYFYRNNPLYFHFVVDEITEKILKKLFETWNLPETTIKFYSVAKVASRVQWVPTHHYSGIYGLLKLIFPTIIPPDITNKIIILDTDLIFTGDIYELWQFFSNFNADQVMALVENQSGYYLGTLGYKPPWPAIGKGVNSGVVLYDLQRMRSMNWNELWVKVAKATTKVRGKPMGDQDILNAIINNNPRLLYNLPCYWNTQMSDHTDSYECYVDNEVKIIHWNTPFKTKVTHKAGDYFRPINDMFIAYSGDLSVRKLHKCSPMKENSIKTTIKDDCLEFQQPPNKYWRTFLYFSPFKYQPYKFDVTLVSHLPFSKLHVVEELALKWSGPMSLAVYLTDLALNESFHFVNGSKVLASRSNIGYHAVFKDRDYYPVNALRNVALENVVTPYVFEVDIDAQPMEDLYSKLKLHIMHMKTKNKKALIVPALQTRDYTTKIPKNKTEAMELIYKKDLYMLGYNRQLLGRESVSYTNWKNAKRLYEVKWKSLFQPYVVVPNTVSKYNERIFDYSWSKILHTMELAAQHYTFIVLPDVFVVNRKPSNITTNQPLLKRRNYMSCWQNLKKLYIHALNKKYHTKFNDH